MGEYIVEYDYDAVHEDELTIRVGDIIKNVTRLDEEGWLEGEVNGRRGAFPDNFVKEIKKQEAEPKEENVPKREKGGNVANLVQRMSVIGIPGIGPPPPNKLFKKKSKKRQCKVLFEYIPQNEDELELKVGDVLEINEEVEEGWWSGTCSGRSGLFPSNFVKEVDLSDDAESQESSEDTVEPMSTPVPGPSPASPLLSPAITSEIPPSSVAQPKKVVGIDLRDIFKELKPRMPPAEPEIKKPEKPALTPSPSTKSSRTSIQLDPPRTEVEIKPKAKETCRALYQYDGVNEDELSFKEGDIIHLLSKETGDPGWWRGELNGKEGVFPDNFAVIILDSEKEKPKKPPPPVKSGAVPKPELRLGDKKFTPTKSEEREKDERPSVEPKPLVDLKPSKPAAPVPPKKPSLKSNNLVKPANIPPKRPEKPALPTPSKPNGETLRPKSEPEPFSKTKMDLEHILSRPKSQEVELDGAKISRETASSELSFDELLPTSENLSHPTASRPKMAGKRPPGRFNGLNSHNKDHSEPPKVDHDTVEESAKIVTPEIKKPLVITSSPSVFTPTSTLPKPSSVPMSPILVDIKTKPDLHQHDGKKSEVEELRIHLNELLATVDVLRKEHRKEIDKLKKDLEEEKLLRSNLEVEIDKLKKAVLLT